MSLNITSMADIFTILLVFLLKSYSVGLTTIAPSNDVMLPEVVAADDPKEAVKLEIGTGTVLLDDKPVTQLKGFQFEPSDLTVDGTPRSLDRAFDDYRARKPASMVDQEEPVDDSKAKKSSRLLVLADQRTPYSTLSAVMASAGGHGFTEIKLVVVEDQ